MKENSSVVGGGELAVVRGAQRYHNVSSRPHFVNFFFIFSKLERFFIRANQNTCVSLFVFSQTYKRVVGFRYVKKGVPQQNSAWGPLWGLAL